MELMLWRWSTAVQCTSAFMIAVFFIALARSVRRAELRPWVIAWAANVAALMVAIILWFLHPESLLSLVAMRWMYFFSKTTWAVMLVAGAYAMQREPNVRLRRLLVMLLAYSIIASALVKGMNQDGALQDAVTAVILFAGAFAMLLVGTLGAGWLTCGFLARATLAGLESVAYASRVFPTRWSSSQSVTVFLSSHSSLDAGAEWAVALGCVLLFYRTIQRELTLSNSDLLASQNVLRELVDIDPLTGLFNRRSLRPALQEAAASGAAVLFFDLDDFKTINDSYGHQAGDDCLRRFARALEESFGSDDHLVRYAGDEFVVVARNVGEDEIAERLGGLEDRLRSDGASGPTIRYTVGRASLAAGGSPDDALTAADIAMYRSKRRTTPPRPAAS
jgi:diguanylate cyclase (GGDEF)-like protein